MPANQPSDELGLDGFRPAAQSDGLSLDQLSGAFARMLGSGEDPYQQPGEEEEDVEIDEALPLRPAAADEADAKCDVSPRTILEAMLFLGTPDNRPLTSREVAALMRGVRPAEIDGLVRELNARYDADGAPYTIVGEGAGYRMALRPEFDRVRERFYGRTRSVRLSQAAIDVLSIVAYNEPISREEVSGKRGKPSGSILRQLVRRELLSVERSEENSRERLFRTTARFLRLFGLESLDDLPRSEEIEKR